MCFDHDYDWIASVSEDTVGTAIKLTKCDECGEMIPVGAFIRHIYQQEHEECVHDNTSENYDFEGEHEGEGCPEGCEHDYGETYHYDRCETCDQLIEAIHQQELEEGCAEHESRPALTEAFEAFAWGRGVAYLAKAEALYPGITERLPESFLYAASRDPDND